MKDIECPYCFHEQEVCHDDGFGTDEGEIYQDECEKCGKFFTFTVSISFSYDAEQAPCLNGEDHKWKQMIGAPKEYFIGRFRCDYCNEEKYESK